MNTCYNNGCPQCSYAYRTKSVSQTAIPPLPDDPVVAMAYVPYQQCADIYSCEKALAAGTVFPVLDKPLLAGCCR